VNGGNRRVFGGTVVGAGVAKRVLVVGAGAREHALALRIADGGAEVLVAPGNAGTAEVGRSCAVRADDVPGLVDLAAREGVDLVVVGPELPLALGLVDALTGRGILAFGPSRAAAQLEASKAYMKRFLARHGIPTAPFEVHEDPVRAREYVRRRGAPIVVKADGLAAGKGVVVAASEAEAQGALERMMGDREFGDAGRTVVVEDVLPGEEASFHVVSDGERFVTFAAAQDHKRVRDGDRGPNTGGMGAYAPAPLVTPEVHGKVLDQIILPTLAAMKKEGAPFRGVLFAGLMIDAGEPRVLEFNVRFGDPEATVLLPLCDGDLLALLEGAARGHLPEVTGTRPGSALSVVMAAEGYPGKPRTGDVIEGLGAQTEPGAFVLHAGTTRGEGGSVVTAGGRVLTVGAVGATLTEAAAKAYRTLGPIHFRGEHHRTDIGHRAK
jgi:phosphoribosylamine---glycine ligase